MKEFKYVVTDAQGIDEKAIAEFKDVKEKVEQYLNVFKFREAQKEAMNLARRR